METTVYDVETIKPELVDPKKLTPIGVPFQSTLLMAVDVRELCSLPDYVSYAELRDVAKNVKEHFPEATHFNLDGYDPTEKKPAMNSHLRQNFLTRVYRMRK